MRLFMGQFLNIWIVYECEGIICEIIMVFNIYQQFNFNIKCRDHTISTIHE